MSPMEYSVRNSVIGRPNSGMQKPTAFGILCGSPPVICSCQHTGLQHQNGKNAHSADVLWNLAGVSEDNGLVCFGITNGS